MIVANQLTPLTRREAASALAEAYSRVTGDAPSTRVLALLLAQTAFETLRWQKLHNFNFGNAKAEMSYPLITQFRCSEVVNGVNEFFDPPDPHCNFRAYTNPADGAVDYIKVLKSRPHWWGGLQTESPNAFVDALATTPKYFTGNPDVYKHGVASLFHEFCPLAEAAARRPCLARWPSRQQSSSERSGDRGVDRRAHAAAAASGRVG